VLRAVLRGKVFDRIDRIDMIQYSECDIKNHADHVNPVQRKGGSAGCFLDGINAD
jgi:hypothetical protein